MFGGEWGNYTDADSAQLAAGAYLSFSGSSFYDPANARFLTRGGPGANGCQSDDPNYGYWFSRLANFVRPAANLPRWTNILFPWVAGIEMSAGTVVGLHDSAGQWGWDTGDPNVSEWDTQVAGAKATADVVLTAASLGDPLASGIKSLGGKAAAGAERTYITYVIKDSEGEVAYVGKSSGVGTPQQVLAERLRGGRHDWYGPGDSSGVIATQGNKAANAGAEDVWYEYYTRVKGLKLRNVDPPLSVRASRLPATRSKIEAYANDLRGP